MKKSVFTLERTQQLAGDVWELILAGDTSAVTASTVPSSSPSTRASRSAADRMGTPGKSPACRAGPLRRASPPI